MHRVVAVAILSMHLAILSWQAWRYSPTIDEPAHLIAGLSHWKFSRFDLYSVNPPLVRLVATVPLLLAEPATDWTWFTDAPYQRPEFRIGASFVFANGERTFWYLTVARLACIPFSCLGALACYRWARELYGERSGLVALALWCLCPNILGNGSLITPDVPAAALGVLACYSFYRWLDKPGWKLSLASGVALGMAELTKFTWILLFLLWPVLVVIHGVWFNRPRSRCRSRFKQLLVMMIVALAAINLGYRCQGSFRSLGDFRFVSQTLGGPEAHMQPGNVFSASWLRFLPIPLPADYVRGIDIQKYEFERGKPSFLRGEQRMGGWWYYYLYAMAVKVPIGTQLLFALACVLRVLAPLLRVRYLAACRPLHEEDLPAGPRRDVVEISDFVLLVPACTVIAVVSSQVGFSRYLRYVLLSFPLLFIWSSQAAALVPAATSRLSARSALAGANGLARIIFVLVLASSLSALAVVPHSLSYFNEWVGGPLRGASHLLDGNIDWGQDLHYLKEWYDENPQARPFHAARYGSVDPSILGIESQALTPGAQPSSGDASKLRHHPPGWYAIGVHQLTSDDPAHHRRNPYAWLRAHAPVARIGYSILIFHITEPIGDPGIP